MCTFLSQLPKHSKSNGVTKRKSMVISLKPCPEENGKQTWYRFRLLAWSSPEKNDRDDPFIERFVHQIWRKNDKGFSELADEVTCPVTKHVNVDGNRYDACPICKLANQYFLTWKESGWKDREAAKKNKEIGRKYQGIIPVYVRNDPNYPQNNGKIKVLIFSDKKLYTEFRSKVEKASQTACVFNGKHAVDCCIHMSEVPEVRNAGQPNEYVYKNKVIDKITFTKAESAYDIPAITKELVTNSGFDEEYYTTSTPEELQAFYDRYYKISNDDIPEEDDLPVYELKKTETSIAAPTSLENTDAPVLNDDISDDDIDELTADIDTEVDLSIRATVDAAPKAEETTPDPNTKPDASDTNDTDVESLLKDLDI